ncbi:hypothetical protein [Lignipirellula cremea]|uniref:Uncharacterized protein n=1 Tax=Lignipirellula cremea TaxID=2528010 RepID=A0A518DW77_9BACT|nr:hypothetical protein [Lignipirellula cremea]QDU96087.1 hypothetical protein Pla8534_39060 [Lignipirellula cremea]
MTERYSRRGFFAISTVFLLGGSVVGCGSILYPERVGQPRGGPLDWKVVALDGVGLIFFFVPGVVAFAVDFYNGAIFLPPCYYQGADNPSGRAAALATVKAPPGVLSQAAIEKIVSREIDRPVRLSPGAYQTAELDSVDQFWDTHDRLAVLPG